MFKVQHVFLINPACKSTFMLNYFNLLKNRQTKQNKTPESYGFICSLNYPKRDHLKIKILCPSTGADSVIR